MKVYELIARLSEMPAGAEVKVSTLKTLAEFAAKPVVDSDDGKDLYEVELDPKEISSLNDQTVIIYD